MRVKRDGWPLSGCARPSGAAVDTINRLTSHALPMALAAR